MAGPSKRKKAAREKIDAATAYQIDDALAFGISEGLGAFGTRAEAVEERHRQHVFGTQLPVHLRKDHVGHVAEIDGEDLPMIGLVRKIDLAEGVGAELFDDLPGLIAGDDAL